MSTKSSRRRHFRRGHRRRLPLEVEGLLAGDVRGHLLARVMSSRQVLEVYDVRAAFEVPAASKLAGRSDRRLIVAELRQMRERLTAGVAVRPRRSRTRSHRIGS